MRLKCGVGGELKKLNEMKKISEKEIFKRVRKENKYFEYSGEQKKKMFVHLLRNDEFVRVIVKGKIKKEGKTKYSV